MLVLTAERSQHRDLSRTAAAAAAHLQVLRRRRRCSVWVLNPLHPRSLNLRSEPGRERVRSFDDDSGLFGRVVCEASWF